MINFKSVQPKKLQISVAELITKPEAEEMVDEGKLNGLQPMQKNGERSFYFGYTKKVGVDIGTDSQQRYASDD